MPDLEWNRVTWSEPKTWLDAGDEWSRGWGGPPAQWYGAIFPRIARWLPAARILEIAPGFGRWTQFLLRQSDEYYGVDYSPLCITQCKKRFSGSVRAHFIQNDGRSLGAIPDNSIDFVFSFDSLVHVELDVLGSYCEQINRKLNPSGVAFLHHSNARNGVDAARGLYPQAGRAISVSAAAVKEVIENTGGRVLIQEEVNWESVRRIDCMTTFSRNIAYTHLNYKLIENDDFMVTRDLTCASLAHYF